MLCNFSAVAARAGAAAAAAGGGDGSVSDGVTQLQVKNT